MIRLILAQLPVNVVGGEQGVGGGSGEGSGDTDMVDDVRREAEGVVGEEAEVGRFFVSEEDQGEEGEAGWKRAMTSSCSEKVRSMAPLGKWREA